MATSKRQGKKRLLLGFLLFLVLFIVALLPDILFSQIGLSFFLAQVNRRIEGVLTIEKCDASWTGGLDCQALSYHNPLNGSELFVKTAKIDRGLLELFAAPHNVGVITLSQPTLSLERPLASREALLEDFFSTGVGAEDDQVPFWEKFTGHLLLEKGCIVTIDREEGNRELVTENLALQAQLDDGTVTYDLQFQVDNDNGSFHALGFVNLPIRYQPILPNLVSQTELEVSHFDVSTLFELLPLLVGGEDIPQGKGTLDGKWYISSLGLENIKVQGSSQAKKLALTGGVLGEDTPLFHEVDIKVDLQHTTGKWDVSHIMFNSEPLSFSGQGYVDAGSGEMTAEGMVDLSVLLQMFPKTLKIKEGNTIDKGKLDFSASLTRDGKRSEVTAHLKTGVVQGVYKEQPIVWDHPFSCTVSLQEEQGQYFFPGIELASSFFSVSGKGGFDTFSFTGRADLNEAVTVLSTFFDLDFKLGGAVDFTGSSVLLVDQKYQFETSFDSQDFSLSNDSGKLVTNHPFHLTSQVILPKLWTKDSALDLHLVGKSRLGYGVFKGTGLQYDNRMLSGQYTLETLFDLGAVTEYVQKTRLVETAFNAEGEVTFKSSGRLDPGLLTIRELALKVTDLSFLYNTIGYEDQQVSFFLGKGTDPSPATVVSVLPLLVQDRLEKYQQKGELRSIINFDKRSIHLQGVSFDSGVVQIPSAFFLLSDWHDPESGLKVIFHSQFTMESVTEIVQQLELLDAETSFRGQVGLSGNISDTVHGLGGQLKWQSKDFALSHDGVRFFSTPLLNGATAMEYDAQAKTIYFAPYTIESDTLSVTGELLTDLREPVWLRVKQARLYALEADEEIIKQIISRTQPLLRELVATDKMVNIRIKEVAWQGQDPEQVAFIAVADTNNLSLHPRGIIEEIFSLFYLQDRPLKLKTRQMVCEGGKQRVTCSPLHIMAGDAEISLTGYVGYDSKLHYLLQLPVTSELADKKGYRLEDPRALTVPIWGTVEKPQFNRKTTSQKIDDLLSSHAVKYPDNDATQPEPGLLDRLIGQ